MGLANSNARIPAEARNFDRCKKTVTDKMKDFLEVGQALTEINSRKYYLATHAKFEDFCRDEFDIGRVYTPRYYQKIAIDNTVRSWEDSPGSLVRLMTSGGNTLMACFIIDQWLKRGDDYRVIVLAQERQLIRQFVDKIEDNLGIRSTIEMGNLRCDGQDAVTIASRQILYVRDQDGLQVSRLFKFDNKFKWLVVLDDAHRWARGLTSVAPIIDLFEKNPDSKRVGLTATPEQTDGTTLESLFPTISVGGHQSLALRSDGSLDSRHMNSGFSTACPRLLYRDSPTPETRAGIMNKKKTHATAKKPYRVGLLIANLELRARNSAEAERLRIKAEDQADRGEFAEASAAQSHQYGDSVISSEIDDYQRTDVRRVQSLCEAESGNFDMKTLKLLAARVAVSTKVDMQEVDEWRLDQLADAVDELEARRTAGGTIDEDEGEKQSLDIGYGIDFRSIRWFGTIYSFTAKQAPVARMLFEHWQASTPDVGDETLLSAVDHEAPPSRLAALFREHPAWNEMIVPGGSKGTHRLAEPPENNS